MKNVVHNCDCMEFMKELPDNHYDLAIVDPPYGIHKKLLNGSGFMKNSPQRKMYKEKQWDKEPPKKEYWDELFRISCNQIICGGNYFPLKPTRGIIAWVKPNMKNHPAFSQWEIIWTSFDSSAKVFYCCSSGSSGGDLKQKEKNIHPTQKPVALYKWLLENYAEPGQRIFDSHVGSGSSRIACYDMGFEFEGCELDKGYWEAQEIRFNNYKSQGELFGKNEYQELIYKKRG